MSGLEAYRRRLDVIDDAVNRLSKLAEVTA